MASPSLFTVLISVILVLWKHYMEILRHKQIIISKRLKYLLLLFLLISDITRMFRKSHWYDLCFHASTDIQRCIASGWRETNRVPFCTFCWYTWELHFVCMLANTWWPFSHTNSDNSVLVLTYKSLMIKDAEHFPVSLFRTLMQSGSS